jgi:hypothetical protein
MDDAAEVWRFFLFSRFFIFHFSLVRAPDDDSTRLAKTRATPT